MRHGLTDNIVLWASRLQIISSDESVINFVVDNNVQPDKLRLCADNFAMVKSLNICNYDVLKSNKFELFGLVQNYKLNVEHKCSL